VRPGRRATSVQLTRVVAGQLPSSGSLRGSCSVAGRTVLLQGLRTRPLRTVMASRRSSAWTVTRLVTKTSRHRSTRIGPDETQTSSPPRLSRQR
jgi:hypothetical protein